MRKACLKKTLPMLIVAGLMLPASNPQAKSVEVAIKIIAQVHIPPCKVNDDKTINVSFRKIALRKVNGQNFAQTRTVSVSCDYYQGTPWIVVTGNQLSGAADHVLRTSGKNASRLGIALYQGSDVNSSYPLKIGVGEQGKYGYQVTRGLTGSGANKQFTFTAVPYKYGGSELLAGEFSATATMSINYL